MKSLFICLLTLISIASLLSGESLAQLKWRTLNTPLTPVFRFEDIFFINAKTGWTITSNSVDTVYASYILKTTDGGASWSNQVDNLSRFYRCLGFADSLNGWIGSLGFDYRTIIRTTNGGTDWIPSLTTPPSDSSNVCGLYVVNKNLVYGCGRYYGPAKFYKTTNGGISWTIKDMSAHARGLVDCYFSSPDSGFVIGGVDGIWPDLKGVVLFTSDGGETWTEQYRTTIRRQLGWKISFLSRNTGYVSFNSHIPQNLILKTTNGGVNWVEKPFITNYYQEGIGFINENTGWVGGSIKTYKTTNGGNNWVEDNFGTSLNRFRFLGDTLAYSAGKNIYKLSRDSTVGINLISSSIAEEFNLKQNYPNPFNPGTKIKFDVASPVAEVRLEVYNSLGQIVEVLINKILTTGTYEVEFSAQNHASGVYYYRLMTNNYAEIKKMMLVK
jgi:photosystem II stability/assembly factor-like uncharacterized protein